MLGIFQVNRAQPRQIGEIDYFVPLQNCLHQAGGGQRVVCLLSSLLIYRVRANSGPTSQNLSNCDDYPAVSRLASPGLLRQAAMSCDGCSPVCLPIVSPLLTTTRLTDERNLPKIKDAICMLGLDWSGGAAVTVTAKL